MLSALRYSSFQVGFIITTTGFITADYGQWPVFSQMILLGLMFVGACSGSTGGGIKISRVVIYYKNTKNELYRLVHPHSVKTVEFENQPIDNSIINTMQAYIILYTIIFFISLLVLSFFHLDFKSGLLLLQPV